MTTVEFVYENISGLKLPYKIEVAIKAISGWIGWVWEYLGWCEVSSTFNNFNVYRRVEEGYRTGSGPVEANLPDEHSVLLQLCLHQRDQVAQFYLHDHNDDNAAADDDDDNNDDSDDDDDDDDDDDGNLECWEVASAMNGDDLVHQLT